MRKAVEEIALPDERLLDAGHAGFDHQSAGDAVARAHAAEVERLLDVFKIAVPVGTARCLLHGIGEQISHLQRIEAQQRGGRGGRAEIDADGMGRVDGGVRRRIAERHVETRADVIAERDRADEVGAAACR